jgi:hypothetical protein
VSRRLIFVGGGSFDTLQVEKARFEAGRGMQLAATFAEKVVFPDCYEFFRVTVIGAAAAAPACAGD